MKIEDKLNKVLKDYEQTKIRVKQLEELKVSLEKNQFVIKYLTTTKELTELKNKENCIADETQDLKIKLCDEKYGGHFYVTDRPKKDTFWENETVVTCIHCGVKTNINEHIHVHIDDRDFRDFITEELLINVHGVYVDDELEEVKKIYDKFKSEYPNATDEDIENHISLVKKMRGGKLC